MGTVMKSCSLWRFTAIVAAVFAISACSDNDNDDELIEGVFLDSAVEGLEYDTGSTTGITDEAGTFYYHEGESITFSVGGIVLGEVIGEAVISPYSFFTTDSASPDIVINIARFLQSLDADGDPSNGILINDDVRLEAENLSLIFDMSSESFSDNSELTNVFSLFSAHLEYTYEQMVSIEAAAAHLAQTLGTDTGDESDTGGDDGSDTGGDDGSDTGGDDGSDTGGDDGSDTGGDDGSDTGGDDGSDTGGDDDSDTGGDDGSGTGGDDDSGTDDAISSLSISGNDGALSSFWDTLDVRDIAVGYVEFTGVETSILLVGGEDADSAETLSGLATPPNNAFAVVAAFADGTSITGATIISVVDSVEYNFECTINCEITIDVESQMITFENSEFIWEDGNDSIFVSGTVPWLDGDEYVDTSDWVGADSPVDNTFCATNLATTTTAQLDGGLSYTTDIGACVGLLSVESNKFTKPLTATIVTRGEGASSGSLSIDDHVKIYTRTVDKGINYVNENAEPMYETIVEGALEITNTSEHELCISDIDDWQMLKADGTELVKSETVSYSFNNTTYEYDFTSFNRFNLPGLDCLAPNGTTTIHLSLYQFFVGDSEELLLPEVAEITLALEAEYNLVPNNTTYTALTPNYMEWLYVNGSPGIRFAFTNNTGVQMVQDDTHPVWYYDGDGYPILKSYVYLHDQLGIDDDELVDSDFVVNDGEQVLLLDDSAEIAILALGGGNAIRAVLYPDF